jgi:hypothetical protein
MNKPTPTPEQKARAERLRNTIGSLSPAGPSVPKTPRDLTEKAAAEARAQEKKKKKEKGS